eukprot:GFUD01017407.1.p1 GENE.GFUD01017407.1~~GFUD01017407.1.p1  ORF type:complete len:160 (-),score=37.41 GFUD01017407.1:238-717(-)
MVQPTISLAISCYIAMAAGFNVEDFFNSVGSVLGDGKDSIKSLIGLEEGKEADYLNNILKSININQDTFNSITSSFTNNEDITKLLETIKNSPEKLEGYLADQTNLDTETITGFAETIKNQFRANENSGTGLIKPSENFAFGIMFVFFVIRAVRFVPGS